MTINVNGQNVESYRLIMKKNNALDILSGKKKLEIRTFNDVYISMFFDKKKREQQEKEQAEGKEVDLFDALKPTKYVRFTNYNESWFLDVELSEIGIETIDEDGIKGLSEDFNFHELDNEWQQYKDLKDEEKPIFFYLAIKSIINHNNMK